MGESPRNARKVGGVWLPATEDHFAYMLLHKSKVPPENGVHSYQRHKLIAAMKLQPTDRRRIAIDIGAHVGLWSMWLTREFEHIHAFEPVPAHAELFGWNVRDENVTLHRYALGKEPGTISITIPLSQTGGSFVGTKPNPGTKYNINGEFDTVHGVEQRTLDSFEFDSVDFIKIDVEGYEREVLQGAEQTIRRWKPNIVVEQKGNEAVYGEPRNAALMYLESLGMTPVKNMGGDWLVGW